MCRTYLLYQHIVFMFLEKMKEPILCLGGQSSVKIGMFYSAKYSPCYSEHYFDKT